MDCYNSSMLVKVFIHIIRGIKYENSEIEEKHCIWCTYSSDLLSQPHSHYSVAYTCRAMFTHTYMDGFKYNNSLTLYELMNSSIRFDTMDLG